MGGGGTRESSSTTTSSPYDGLPEWAEQYYQSDMDLAGTGVDASMDIRNFLARNPRAIEGVSQRETDAVNDVRSAGARYAGTLQAEDGRLLGAEGALSSDLAGALEEYGGFQDSAQGRLRGIEDTLSQTLGRVGTGFDKAMTAGQARLRGAEAGYADDLTDIGGEYSSVVDAAQGRLRGAEAGYSDTLARIGQRIDPLNARLRSDLDEARGMIGGDDFTSAYTDDVVDTTLSGIDRQAARERMARGASEASIGGLSSTRSAVADMLAQESTARTRAETEAQLRDQAHRFGVDSGFTAADALARYAGSDFDAGSRGIDQLSGMAGDRFNAMSSGVDSELASRLNEAELLSGFAGDRYDATASGVDSELAAWLDRSDLQRGMAGDRYSAFSSGVDSELDAAQYGTDLRGQSARDRFESILSGAGERRGSAADVYGSRRNSAQASATLGELNRGLRQQQSDEIRTAGQQAQDWWSGVFSTQRQTPATGSSSSTSTERSPAPSFLSQALGVGASAAGIWASLSDERVKEDVEPSTDALGKLRGIPAYSYRYKNGFESVGGPVDRETGRTDGLMAQDIERAGIKGAVQEVDGVKVVNPYPVLATVVQAVRELDARTRGQMKGL